MANFNAVEKGTHGDTVYCEDPKIEAYKQIAYIVNVLGRGYQLVCQVDGTFTVNADGIASISYTKG